MKSRQFLLCAFLTALGVMLSSHVGQAQTAAPSSTATTTPPVNLGTTTPGAGTSTSSSTAVQLTLKIQSSNSGNGSATTSPSNTNSNTPWYGDALSMGLPSQWVNGPPKATGQITGSKVTFGKGIYTATTNLSAGGGAQGATQNQGFTTVGIVRNPQYTTGLADDIPRRTYAPAAIFAEAKDVIDRSTKFKNKAAIEVAVNGEIVVLSGTVASDRERLVAEGMVRMSPGVRGVQNDLQVIPSK